METRMWLKRAQFICTKAYVIWSSGAWAPICNVNITSVFHMNANRLKEIPIWMKFVWNAFQKLAKNFSFDISQTKCKPKQQKCILLTKMPEITKYKVQQVSVQLMNLKNYNVEIKDSSYSSSSYAEREIVIQLISNSFLPVESCRL